MGSKILKGLPFRLCVDYFDLREPVLSSRGSPKLTRMHIQLPDYHISA